MGLPLPCILIIPHFWRFVKHYFYAPLPDSNGLYLLLAYQGGACGGRGGCRPHYPLSRNGFTDRRVCRFSVLSLICEFIVSHLELFVKRFFYFFWCDGLESNQHSTTTQAMCPATLKDHHIMSGFCSRHIPNIVSACGVWFTFVSRYTYTPCGRVIGRGLTDSRGHPHFVVASPSPVVLLL